MNSNKLKGIKGSLEYQPPINQPKYNNQFSFLSDNSDTEIIIKKNAKLKTGVSIKGDFFYSKSLSGKESELLFLIDNEKKISIKSKSFLINDNEIFSPKTKLNLYDNKDSIYHPLVEFNFDLESNKIQTLNIEGVLKNTPFYSSFFNIELDPDQLTYVIGEDNIYFSMIVAPSQRPLNVYSKNHFSNQKLNQMTDLNGTNILKAVFTYYS